MLMLKKYNIRILMDLTLKILMPSPYICSDLYENDYEIFSIKCMTHCFLFPIHHLGQIDPIIYSNFSTYGTSD